MSYRSWLKDVKRLDDLAKHLHFFPRNYNDDDREWKLEEKMVEELRKQIIPVDPAQEKYFQGWLHDGYVSGVERTQDRVEITILDLSLAMFCDEYFAETEQDKDAILSPVRLVFEGVNYANAVRPDAEGWLKWDDWSRWRPIVDFRRTDTFLRCWFHEQEGKVQWIGQFHKPTPGESKLGWSLFILIDCDHVTVKPESERALRKKLGDDCYDAMQFIDSLPPSERWLTTGHLRRYLDEKGINRRVIPHQSERE